MKFTYPRPEIHSMFGYSLLFQLIASLTKCRILIGSQQPLFILNLDDAAPKHFNLTRPITNQYRTF